MVDLNSPYDNSKGWDDTQNGQEVTEGTYYYVISVVDNCIKDDIAGTVTIVRWERGQNHIPSFFSWLA